MGIFNSGASTSEADAGAQGAVNMFQAGVGYEQPYAAQGGNAIPAVNNALGIGGATAPTNIPISAMLGTNRLDQTTNPYDTNTIGATYQQSPGVAFQLQQGKQAIDNSSAAKGGLLSGANIEANDTFAQGTANQDYNTYVANQQNAQTQNSAQVQQAYNNLYGQETIGSSAANAILGASTSTGSSLVSAGNSAAAATASQGNSANQLLGQVGNGIFSML